jgi:hypothetical protein
LDGIVGFPERILKSLVQLVKSAPKKARPSHMALFQRKKQPPYFFRKISGLRFQDVAIKRDRNSHPSEEAK